MTDNSTIFKTPDGYRELFQAIETSLFANSSDPDALRERLSWTHSMTADRKFNDEYYFDVILTVIFASGFNAQTARAHHPALRRYFPDIATAAAMSEKDLDRVLQSGDVIAHANKLKACVTNARTLQAIAAAHGSMQQFIDHYRGDDSLENLQLLSGVLRKKFAYVGKVTVYHLMTDAALPVLKPDLVITRLFWRLGLIDSQINMELPTITHGRRFAEATGHTMRYVDAILVNYGQQNMWDGSRGICMDRPRCDVCGVKPLCQFYKQKQEG